MFRLLKLKPPPNGWHAVGWELAIVTVGVLMALGAQQLVDDWQWRRQVGQANDVFKNELGQAAGNAYERLAIQPCLTNRLKALAERLNEPGPGWRGMPEQFHGAEAFFNSVLPVVYRPPHRPMPSDGWSNALVNGTMNHLSTDRALTLSAAYHIARKFADLQDQEATFAAKLAPLATDRALSPEERLELFQVVSALDRTNSLMVTESKDLLEAVRAADLGYTDAEVRGYAQQSVRLQRAYRGGCVTAPPIDLN